MKTLNTLQKNLGLLIVLSLISPTVTWLAYVGLCLYDGYLSACQHPYGSPLALVVGLALPLLGTVRILWAKYARRLDRRYARPVASSSLRFATFDHVARFIWEGAEAETDHPLLSYGPRHGWVVPFDDGPAEVVLWDDMREWVYQSYEIDQQRDAQLSNREPFSQRTWDKLRRRQWQARTYILNLLSWDVVRPTSLADNAPLRPAATPWRIMSELAEVWPPVRVV